MNTHDFTPAYLPLHENGELGKRAEMLWQRMQSCDLCPRECGVNRLKGEEGICRASAQLEVASYHPHFGEERPLVGRNGSGTIFFSNCGLRCVFCINWDISHEGQGTAIGIDQLARMMLALQDRGCHNINVVTPTHYLPHILMALDSAAAEGLRLPLVYNTCGWEKLDVLQLLDGIVDIYLPDCKYADDEMAATYSAGARSYPAVARAALLEMQRQVGTAHPGPDGVMRRGLMIRHLVMPNGVSGSQEIIRWIAENLPHDSYVNIMSQYRPCYRAFDYTEIAWPITTDEYRQVVQTAIDLGLTNLDIQGRY